MPQLSKCFTDCSLYLVKLRVAIEVGNGVLGDGQMVCYYDAIGVAIGVAHCIYHKGCRPLKSKLGSPIAMRQAKRETTLAGTYIHTKSWSNQLRELC